MTAPSIFDFVDALDAAPSRADEPSWLAAPTTPLEGKFKAFHEQNPQMYRELERRSVYEASHGAARLSIAKMAEQLRADPSIASIGDAFKINNSYRALYARLLIHRHPELDGKFEIRERREKSTEDVDSHE
jgi:hypothetical protein